MTPPIPRILALATLAAALGCESLPKVSGAPVIPFTTKDMLIGDVTPFAGYLRVEALAPGRSRILYVKDTEECRALAQSGDERELRSIGHLGRFEDGEAYCDVVGTESLRELRDSMPRQRAPGKPRAMSRWREVARTDELILLRGQFPMVSMLGWAGDDITTVIPNDPDCNAIAAEGESFMEFEVSREPVLTLASGELRCVVRGVIRVSS